MDPRAPALVLVLASLGSQSETTLPWSFAPVGTPAPPVLEDDDWSREPWDAFVLARLRQAGLEPSPEAEPAVLLRRLSLDLTGLPPTPAEIEAFVLDTRPDAYERAVERLLTSPHHGERMAEPWLDLARYADTNGYRRDSDRQMWAWRDWVVEAFNDNLSFADFTVQQMAGDLLPEPTLSQRIATGFHRNHSVHDDVLGQPGEYDHQYVADRVATAATAWMGLTMACAECHDHRNDPISQLDYYRFYGFFNSVPEKGLTGEGNAEPFLRLPDAGQGARLLELQAELDTARRQVAGLAGEPESRVDEWLADLGSRVDAGTVPESDRTLPLDEDRPGEAELQGIGQASWVPGVLGQALELGGTDSFVDCGPADELTLDQPFTVSLWAWLEPDAPGGTFVARILEFGTGPGFEFWDFEGTIGINLQGDASEDDGLNVRTFDPVPFRAWNHLAVTYDGSRTRAGVALYVNGRRAEVRPARPTEPERIEGNVPEDLRLRLGGIDGFPMTGRLDQVRIRGHVVEAQGLLAEFEADLIAGTRARAGRDLAWSAGLRRHYAEEVSPAASPIARRAKILERERRELLDVLPMVSVLSERGERRPTHLLERGRFDLPGRVVEPGLPAHLPQLLDEPPTDRLSLARWMVHPENPLVPRVAVNRLWQQFFGRGLVRTPADFGNAGEPPSHPELLDWLARHYVACGYDTREMIRSLVYSATYRQSSRIEAKHLERDPENTLLGRAGRWRLGAESLHDQALFLSGLLDPTLGGPPVQPPQPGEIWGPGIEDEWPLRRGLYVYRKRHAPYAPFALFDAPTREVCVAERTSTTTPLQVLSLWNEPLRLRAIEALAGLLREAEGTETARLEYGFQLCTGRRPSSAELRILAQLLDQERSLHTAVNRDEQEARAHVALAEVLLALDATTTRE